MRLRWIPHLSPAYALCVALRRDILRKPMVLHARATAVPFYLRLGYTEDGPGFEEVGLPHQSMEKPLG